MRVSALFCLTLAAVGLAKPEGQKPLRSEICLLRVSGAGIDDEYRQTFGFREFWVEGKRFFLNGKEIRLRPACLPDEWTIYSGAVEYIDGVLDGLMKVGFNAGEQ
ncbi:hypothetical protein [Fervidibacter sp.]|jgi:beta-galactosidase/beta-glucuronidase